MKTFLIVGKNEQYDGVNEHHKEITDMSEKMQILKKMNTCGISAETVKIFDESQMIEKSPLFSDAIKSIIDVYFPKTWNPKKSLYNYYTKPEVISKDKVTTYVYRWENASIDPSKLDRIRYIYDDKDKDENQTVLIVTNK